MPQSNLEPFKENIDLKEISGIIDSSHYPKPRWMLNESIREHTWLLSKVGFDPSFHEKYKNKARKLCFDRTVARGESLTDQINLPLLTDIQNSLLYLDITGKITRPSRVSDILLSATHLIHHANELRHARKEIPVRSLEQIKFEELKDYLLSFGVDRQCFDTNLEVILERWDSQREIDWNWLEFESKLTTRKFASLKHKLISYLTANNYAFKYQKNYNREFEKANTRDFDLDLDLVPNEKTISNEISKLEALHTARPAQRYKFRHSPSKLFSSGRTIFDEMQESVKTPLMPVDVALHALSSSLHFARVYGPPLRQYLSNLNKSELERIDELKLASSTSYHHFSDIKDYAYKITKIPAALEDLNITSWGGKNDKDELNSSDLKQGMSACLAVTLYTAAIWILLASFTTGRTTSLQTLRPDLVNPPSKMPDFFYTFAPLQG